MLSLDSAGLIHAMGFATKRGCQRVIDIFIGLVITLEIPVHVSPLLLTSWSCIFLCRITFFECQPRPTMHSLLLVL